VRDIVAEHRHAEEVFLGGFSGVVAFREDPSLPLAAFQLEWADGRADFDPAAAADRIALALTSALAAEAGHAESLKPAQTSLGSEF
jgi:flagellar assembly protein FliH